MMEAVCFAVASTIMTDIVVGLIRGGPALPTGLFEVE
jgi:hypothetical protein